MVSRRKLFSLLLFSFSCSMTRWHDTKIFDRKFLTLTLSGDRAPCSQANRISWATNGMFVQISCHLVMLQEKENNNKENNFLLLTILCQGPSWLWPYGSWIYNYLYNQCLSPLAQEILFAWEHGALSPDNVKVRNFLSRILVSCQILITYRG
jgi:hypothetical protein